jgi:formylglycine-generating enzyme required for sulfatase activity
MKCYPEEQPEHSATVSKFALDKYEVTVGRFRNFVKEYDTWHRDNKNPKTGDGANPNTPGTGWGQSWELAATDLPADAAELIASLKCSSSYQTWTDSDGTSVTEAYPINCLMWYHAFAFCIWDGGRLPTEVEWEYAAAGGEQNRLYPWGSKAPDSTLANYDNAPLTVVGSKLTTGGAGFFGHADLAGSMWEWTFDWFATEYYGTGGKPVVCNDCANTTKPPPSSDSTLIDRTFRGGGWYNVARLLRSAFRNAPERDTQNGIGIRCARAR